MAQRWNERDDTGTTSANIPGVQTACGKNREEFCVGLAVSTTSEMKYFRIWVDYAWQCAILEIRAWSQNVRESAPRIQTNVGKSAVCG